MYKFIFPVLVVLIAFASCTKNVENSCPAVITKAPDSQIVALGRYLDSNHIVAVQDPRGFFYSISDTGVGQQPNPCSIVTVNYTGKLTDSVNTMFDSNHNSKFTLSQVITGWQEALPLLRKGGSMQLYLPPFLAYGQGSTASIPANSPLIFSIQLVGVQ